MTPRWQCAVILTGLLAVLTLASLISWILRRQIPDTAHKPGIDNLIIRIKAWWVMVLLLGVAILIGRDAVVLLFALLSLLALREFIALVPTRPADHRALLLSFFVALPAQYALVWTNRYALFVTLIPVYALFLLPLSSVARADTAGYLARTSEMQWALMICVFCISHVPALLTLDIPGYSGRTMMLVVFFLVVAQSSDVLQYVFGKLFGRHKIAPAISPAKTVEGFIGGVLAAAALGLALWRITPFDPWQAASMALLVSLSGFLGGLVMSAVKRDRGVKDWGRLIAGHGGVLDRIDSIIFSAPLFFHLTRYFFAP